MRDFVLSLAKNQTVQDNVFCNLFKISINFAAAISIVDKMLNVFTHL